MVRRPVSAALCAAALIATAGLARAAEPAATEPTNKELLEQIKQLQAKVEQLETERTTAAAAAPTTGPTSAEVQRTVEQMVADADRRSTLFLQNGDDAPATAGYEKGKFFIRSEDGNFSWSPAIQLQVRYVLNDSQNIEPSGEDHTEGAMEIRRAKFSFGGHLFTPKLVYNFQWETSQNNGGVSLEDAWLRYEFAKAWYVRGGQFKDITYHEESTSSRRQLAVDRSLLNELIAGGETDYIQGVTAIYDKGDGTPIRAEFGYTDGNSSLNTNWQGTPVNDTDFGAVGRVDYYVTGTRKQYEDFTSLGNKQDLLVFGAGALWDQAGDANTLFHTVDAQYETANGIALYGAFVGQWVDDGTSEAYNWGVVAQGEYLFKPKWGAFGRYDVTFLDEDVVFGTGGANDMFQEFTIGVNYYIEGHAAKFTVDALYLPDGAPENETGIGVLAADGDEFVFRAQFQLLL